MHPQPYTFKVEEFPNDSWTRVEIFLQACDRLPTQKGDGLYQECLDRFCERYEKGELKTTTVDVGKIYRAIKAGKVTLTIPQNE